MPLHATLADPTRLPRPGNPDQAAIGLEHWIERATDSDDPALLEFARAVLQDSTGNRLLAGLFGGSPFLGECLLAEMGFARLLLEEGPEVALARVVGEVAALDGVDDEDTLRRGLRIGRRRTALTVALGDIVGLWTRSDMSTQALQNARAAGAKVPPGSRPVIAERVYLYTLIDCRRQWVKLQEIRIHTDGRQVAASTYENDDSGQWQRIEPGDALPTAVARQVCPAPPA